MRCYTQNLSILFIFELEYRTNYLNTNADIYLIGFSFFQRLLINSRANKRALLFMVQRNDQLCSLLLTSLYIFLLVIFGAVKCANAEELEAIQVYSQDELIELINQNKHLERVKQDRCQIIEDIEARAEVMRIPSFQFLWGDMLAWGVCVDKSAASGVHYMKQAALQGLPAALEQLGRYHRAGKFVRKDLDRAIVYFREASSMGNKRAQLQLADMFIEGHGSPYDYADSYTWLYNFVAENDEQNSQIQRYLFELERRMSPLAVRSARRSLMD